MRALLGTNKVGYTGGTVSNGRSSGVIVGPEAVVQSPAQRVITTPRREPVVATLPQPCEPKNRILGGGPDIAFITVTKIALGGAKGDVAVLLPWPCKYIEVVACDPVHLADSLLLHFQPLNKTYIGNAIVQVGNEPWLPLGPIGSNISKVGAFRRFARPMPQTIYFDIGQETGGTDYFFTIMVANDIEATGVMFPAAGF